MYAEFRDSLAARKAVTHPDRFGAMPTTATDSPQKALDSPHEIATIEPNLINQI
jgi:hypothetical protein